MNKIYYAHFVGIYNTIEEQNDIKLIKSIFPNYKIYNPSEDESGQTGYKKIGMQYFFNKIDDCNILIFKSLTNGKISAGVYKEILYAISKSIPVIEIPNINNRDLSVKETRKLLT